MGGSCKGGDQRGGDWQVKIGVGFDKWVVQGWRLTWWRSVGGKIGVAEIDGSGFDFAMNFGF